MRIPKAVASRIGYYVYIYSHPRTGRPFYVGKGRRSRVLRHLKDKRESRKVRMLRRLKRLGLKPRIDILAHGIKDEETALRIEAAVIDVLGLDRLTNAVSGWKSLELGRMSLRALIAYYRPRPVRIVHPALLIRINRLFRHGMRAQELYEATRGCWILDRERAKHVKYAMAVFEGVVQEVYAVRSWHVAGTTVYRTRTRKDVDRPQRSEFLGSIAPASVRRMYVDRSVQRYLPRGLQSPVVYVNA